MTAHLWAQAPAPLEWVEYVLCERFKVLPSALRREAFDDLTNLLTCMSVESQVERARSKTRGK